MSIEDIFAFPRRSSVALAQKERGGYVAGVLPIHFPRALLRSFDILPMEVWGPPGVDATYGAAHLQAYVCSIVRNALSFHQSSGLEVADLLLVPHACDSLQGFGSILIDFIPSSQPVLTLYLPRSGAQGAHQFLAQELRSLYGKLQQITDKAPSDDDLMGCIQEEEVADQLLAQLFRERRSLPLTDLALYRLARSREFLPTPEFSERIHSVLGLRPPEEELRIPIILSGIVPEPMSLFEAIAELGGVVVADDLACCGRRLYPPGKANDPYRRMAERLLGGPPDPTLGCPIGERLRHFSSLIKDTKARGIIFYEVKFCEPELFDLPLLRRGLSDLGIPSVVIEMDLNDPLSQQTQTRIEALLEMVA